MKQVDMSDVYSTVEFNNWAHKEERLSVTESYLINRYLVNKQGRTLEAGTGGGRILLALQNQGFTSLHGFDFIPELIDAARTRDTTDSIAFEVQNAASLAYPDNHFDQVIYLEQIISVIDGDDKATAIQEAYRILKPNGIALFSFVCMEARLQRREFTPFMGYIRALRKFRGTNQSIQHLPWLRVGGRFNYKVFIDSGPFAYWFYAQEAGELLQKHGFSIIAAGSRHQIKEGRMCKSCEELSNERIKGQLYIVCTKP